MLDKKLAKRQIINKQQQKNTKDNKHGVQTTPSGMGAGGRHRWIYAEAFPRQREMAFAITDGTTQWGKSQKVCDLRSPALAYANMQNEERENEIANWEG